MSVVAIVVAIIVLDVAIQAHAITVQSRMFQIDRQARSRLNTAFVTNNFIFGAVGSGLASFLWPRGGWTAIMIAAAILSGFAFTVGRRAARCIASHGRRRRGRGRRLTRRMRPSHLQGSASRATQARMDVRGQ